MSATRTFLLELHCEEIPARFLRPLSVELADQIAAFCKDRSLTFAGADRHFSPRKLSWELTGLGANQPDQTEIQVGPPQRMCVGEDGQPTIQGQKFAEKWGVGFDQVRFEQPQGKKEPCAVVTVSKLGRPTVELLAEALPKLVAGLHVPKAMRWGRSDFEFVRPIRNILCLFGEEVVPIEVDGVQATAATWGHRLYHRDHPGAVLVQRPEDYEAALERAGVVVSFFARRERLKAQMDALAKAVGGAVVEDEELLDTLAEIVEFPTIVRGAFPAAFLDLPKEVLVTSLKEHQKSFCIQGPDGALLPFFLASANRPLEAGSEAERLVAAGNEWVLKARLYDARFFFAEDLRSKLETRLEKLKNLTFQRELGSYLEKTERIVALSERLARRLGLDAADARQAAQLCKADLRTLMVGEFPELQGIMGGEYLKHEGAPESVWRAVKEHYRPAGAEDAVPATREGGLLAVADKLDTVAGCFSVGIIPSGSKDPLALRRAGQGAVRIAWEQGWAIPLMDLVQTAIEVAAPRATAEAAATAKALENFFQDRVAYQLETSGYAGSARRSALAAGWSDLVDLKARCEALSEFAEDPRFASLAQSAKRIGNILKDEAAADEFDASLLQAPEEKTLAARLAGIESAVTVAQRLGCLAELADPLEAFFNAVMVKCEDPALRAARLSLLHRLRKAFLKVADFRLWQ